MAENSCGDGEESSGCRWSYWRDDRAGDTDATPGAGGAGGIRADGSNGGHVRVDTDKSIRCRGPLMETTESKKRSSFASGIRARTATQASWACARQSMRLWRFVKTPRSVGFGNTSPLRSSI